MKKPTYYVEIKFYNIFDENFVPHENRSVLPSISSKDLDFLHFLELCGVLKIESEVINAK